MPRMRKGVNPKEQMEDLVKRTRKVANGLEDGLNALKHMETTDPELAAADAALDQTFNNIQAAKAAEREARKAAAAAAKAAAKASAAQNAEQPSAARSAPDEDPSSKERQLADQIVKNVNENLGKENKARKGFFKGRKNVARHEMKQNFSDQARDLTEIVKAGKRISTSDVQALRDLRSKINDLENANQKDGKKNASGFMQRSQKIIQELDKLPFRDESTGGPRNRHRPGNPPI